MVGLWRDARIKVAVVTAAVDGNDDDHEHRQRGISGPDPACCRVADLVRLRA
jgi:hypothetical protein